MVSSLLQVQNLSVRFGTVTVVDGIDLSINPGETLALVGESGCGKSVTALSILRLLPAPGIISGGGVAWTGQDLLKLPLRALNDLRGGDIATIWQDPLAALNPVLPIGTPIIEALVRHRNLSSAEARTVAIETLQRVGIAQAEKRLKDYPHQLSGGQRQRVMIAAAIAGKPKLLIADEPTTALDVSVQAQILELLRGLIRDTGTAMLLITHDLGVVAQIANRVAVMYAGQIVEQGTTAQIFEHPQHPYTQGLLLATPRLHGDSMPLPIPGVVPPPGRWPTGCRFKTRCPLYTQPTCDDMPPLMPAGEAQPARCWFAGTPAWDKAKVEA
ncbi:MAG: ABC transporter ATP-binding protein [Abitibacteriaceae bacterium]|nr:ABC transporter ATP-binding protein [Abditibacteriaceae bacterium]